VERALHRLLASLRGDAGAARPAPGTDTSVRAARDVVAGLIAGPPSNLADVERLVGRLDVDMAGPEAEGAGVFRPESPFDHAVDGARPRRGRLRDGIVRAFVSFDYDAYHRHPRTLEGLRPNEVMVSVDLDRVEVLGQLEAAFGPTRSIERDGGQTLEGGSWYYLERWDRPAALSWRLRRPDWAVPPVAPEDAEAFVGALVAALGDPVVVPTAPTELARLAAAAGSTLSWSANRVSVSARPGLPLPIVARAFAWTAAVSWSPDVHMVTWEAGPPDPRGGHPTDTRIGPWTVEVALDGSPRDAPKLGFAGPSPLYDVWNHPVPVRSITATRAAGEAEG